MPTTRPPVDYIARTRAQYDALGYPPYRWVEKTEAPPFVPLEKPVRESRLALIVEERAALQELLRVAQWSSGGLLPVPRFTGCRLGGFDRGLGL